MWELKELTSCAAKAWIVRSSRSIRTQSAAWRSSRSRLRILFSCALGTAYADVDADAGVREEGRGVELELAPGPGICCLPIWS
jgi:hypothetical protein